MIDTAVIIPCRLDSVRFPRKLLHLVNGKPLILWTAERIAAQAPELPLYFAVAEPALVNVLQGAGYQTVATAPELPSGTDRIAAANAHIGAQTVVNIQADEPLVTSKHLRLLIQQLKRPEASIATLAAPFQQLEDLQNPDNVKVVRDTAGFALYFSRAPIPYPRDRRGCPDVAHLRGKSAYAHHLGLYAYKAAFLQKFSSLKRGPLERLEKLEQLRALENGFRIAVGLTSEKAFGVDTSEDAAAFQSRLKSSRRI